MLIGYSKKLLGADWLARLVDPVFADPTAYTSAELLVAVYGGYFGGGIGIMNLAMLSALGMTDIHAMNKLKVILGGIINGVAAATFVVTGAIVWPQASVMIAGSLIGGYSSAHFAQKLPQAWVKSFVILVGTAMTIYFFILGYR